MVTSHIIAAVLATTVVFAAILGIIIRWSPFEWRLLLTIRRARREILKIVRQQMPNAQVFVRQGATRIDPRYLAFWVATDTDKERDQLRSEPNLHGRLYEALVRAGYPTDAATKVYFIIESQETVDRNYGGSWHETMEMP